MTASMDIGWIGTGIMGNAMCGHLISAGHKLHIYNRTPSKASNLIEKGARWCESPRKVAESAAIVFSMVGYPQDVEETVLGKLGIIAASEPDSILVDMSTSSPGLAVKIYEIAKSRQVHALDAPVSGGDVGAREATLAIMAGGDKPIFDRILPLFQHMGRNIAWMGSAGSGQHTKMCNQILIAGTMLGTVESLLYAQRAGLGMDAVIDVIGQGAASSWAINNLGRRIARNNFDPGFMIRHFVKDMGIALAEAARMKLALPGLALVHQFYMAAMAQGYENLGTQGLFQILTRMNQTPSR